MRLLAAFAITFLVSGCAGAMPHGLVVGHADIAGGPVMLGGGTRPASGEVTIDGPGIHARQVELEHGAFRVWLPPGRYRIWVSGWSHDNASTFVVRRGETTRVALHLDVR
jgi:hypothetical protein